MDALHAEIGETGMILRTGKRGVPMKLAIGFLDRQVVDTGVPVMHQAVLVELPVLVAIGAIPIAGVVMPFVGEAHRNPAPLEGPQLFDEAIVLLPFPFAREELYDRRTPLRKLRAIAPPAIDGVGQRYLLRFARIPAIFSQTNLLNLRLASEGRTWWTLRIWGSHGGAVVLSFDFVIVFPALLFSSRANRRHTA